VNKARVSGRPGRTKRWPGRTWDRIASSAQERRGQKIPPIAALQDAIDKRIEEGDSEQDATLGVIEEFERSAATVNAPHDTTRSRLRNHHHGCGDGSSGVIVPPAGYLRGVRELCNALVVLDTQIAGYVL
jgi:hypothetical protein